MNRYAPPAADVGDRPRPYEVGKAGWLAATATLVQVGTIAVGYSQITELFVARPVAVFFVYMAAATSLFLVLGTLLLLARFPSSMLFFTAALALALLDLPGFLHALAVRWLGRCRFVSRGVRPRLSHQRPHLSQVRP